MRINIDQSLCEGYGVCVQSAPEIFALDDDGDSVVLSPHVAGELESSAVLAERSCPMHAVRLG
ncbi:ferredoxin [Nocardia aurea]|uniref:ferredoxin n=1 Tax=Nocardia aurea TaxID=2144174 RepID=UPI000D6A04DC|nr:ferredoxin [Nocardia aurea]